MLGSVLTAHSPDPAWDSVSPALSAPPPLALCLKNKQELIPMDTRGLGVWQDANLKEWEWEWLVVNFPESSVHIDLFRFKKINTR